MKQTLSILLVMVVAVGLGAQTAASPDVLLKAAMQKEQIDNDVPGAIAAFKLLVEKFPKDPATAKALWQLVGLYDRTGEATAMRGALERIVRDHSGEKDLATLAQARLSALDGGIIDRSIGWPENARMAGDVAISPRGRYVTYTDQHTSELAVRDLQTGRSRQLTSIARKGGFVEYSAVSHDEKFVAFVAREDPKDNNTRALRILPISEADKTPARILVRNGDWLMPREWSRDGRQIVVAVNDKIGLVSVSDGSVRLFDPTSSRGLSVTLRMSPDGAVIAYDTRAEGSQQRDVYLMPTDGTPAIAVLTGPSNEKVVGWSADGRHLIFTSDRDGSRGLALWALAIASRKPVGNPILLKAGFQGSVVGLTTTGKLLYEAYATDATENALYTASFDAEKGTLLTAPEYAAHDRKAVNLAPRWSADGRAFLYTTERSGLNAISIKSTDGVVREVPRRLSYVWSLDVSPDGTAMAFRATDIGGRTGIHLMNTVTGELTLIARAAADQAYVMPAFSGDGKKLVYVNVHLKEETWSLLERDLATGATVTLVHKQRDQSLVGTLSPDGRYLWDVSGKSMSIGLISIADGTRRVLFKTPSASALDRDRDVRWMPDGSALIAKIAGAAPNERAFWWIPIDGRPPHKIDIGRTDLVDTTFGIHPDGKQIAFVAGAPIVSKTSVLQTEFRMLDRFLPKPVPAAKKEPEVRR